MKIIVLAPILNEAANIRPFAINYGWADKIIMADGGSTDHGPAMAEALHIDVIDLAHLRVDAPGGSFSPLPIQINALIERAKIYKPDWLILDDCDCWPNTSLRDRARGILRRAKAAAVMAYRLYLWGEDRYFPKMNEPGPSLWAWRPDRVDISADTKAQGSGVRGVPEVTLRLRRPFVLLHRFAPSEEVVSCKMGRKRAKGEESIHPLQTIYAPPEPLPGWAL